MAQEHGSSRTTVLVALGANLAIAIVKGFGGAISGSSALLAEAAHSVADTTNQGLMLVSLSRSERPPDEQHPFGYGKERFFWVLLAAILIFLAGGVFSILEGLDRILRGGGGEGRFVVAYAVLGFALVAESTSLARAVRQTRGEAREAGLGFVEFVRVSKEPTVKTVVSEDSAAVAGVVIALVGTALHELTGQELFDGAAGRARAAAADAARARRRRGRARAADDVRRPALAARRGAARPARLADGRRGRAALERARRGAARGAARRHAGLPRRYPA